LELQSAINFLIGSVLFSVGIIVFSLMVIVVNNLFSKYWKPVKWNIYNPSEFRFIDSTTMKEIMAEEAKLKKEKDSK